MSPWKSRDTWTHEVMPWEEISSTLHFYPLAWTPRDTTWTRTWDMSDTIALLEPTCSPLLRLTK